VSAPVFIVVSARMASSRFAGKAALPLAGRPLLEVLLERMRHARDVDGVVLATTKSAGDDRLAGIARRMGVFVFRGPEDDVLGRYVECARAFSAAHVVRVTGDNPLTDLETLELLVARQRETAAEYTYVPGDALLMGILPEVIATPALERSWERGDASHRSELVTLYIKEHPQEFRIETVALPEGLLHPELRLTVDEAEDGALMQAVFERLQSPGKIVTTREAIALLLREPGIARLNAHLRHKAANLRSVTLDAAILGAKR
jgi:spore coat polysaccharide biosynthesis protein SpsF